jgi:hypothetical protein
LNNGIQNTLHELIAKLYLQKGLVQQNALKTSGIKELYLVMLLLPLSEQLIGSLRTILLYGGSYTRYKLRPGSFLWRL